MTEKSFDSLIKACPSKNISETKARQEFMAHVLRKWFELVVGEIRKIDPHHLVSSPKFSVWDHQPQLELADQAGHFDAILGLFDLISVDWYTAKPEFSQKALLQISNISKKLNLPVLVAEFGTRQKIDGWTNTPGAKTLLSSQKERGERYHSQVLQLFNDKRFIGAHWFRWQDHITENHQMNKGIVQVNGDQIQPYTDLQKAIFQTHQEINSKLKAK